LAGSALRRHRFNVYALGTPVENSWRTCWEKSRDLRYIGFAFRSEKSISTPTLPVTRGYFYRLRSREQLEGVAGSNVGFA
jgi:hypothetical protein